MDLKPQLFVAVYIPNTAEDEQNKINLSLQHAVAQGVIDISLNALEDSFKIGVVEVDKAVEDGSLEVLNVLEHPLAKVLPFFADALHQHLFRFCRARFYQVREIVGKRLIELVNELANGMNWLIKVGLDLRKQSLAKLQPKLLLLCVAVLWVALLLDGLVIHEFDLFLEELRLCSVRLLDFPKHLLGPFFIDFLNVVIQLVSPLAVVIAIPYQISKIRTLRRLPLSHNFWL